jgi:hypothetical protein
MYDRQLKIKNLRRQRWHGMVHVETLSYNFYLLIVPFFKTHEAPIYLSLCTVLKERRTNNYPNFPPCLLAVAGCGFAGAGILHRSSSISAFCCPRIGYFLFDGQRERIANRNLATPNTERQKKTRQQGNKENKPVGRLVILGVIHSPPS